MTRPEAPWGLLVLIGLTIETWALRHKRQRNTLSYAIRATFRTKTHAGRIAFVLGWFALTAWLVPHIITTEESDNV